MNGIIEKYLIRIRQATATTGFYAYRGQENSEWPLHSSATRRLIQEHGRNVLDDSDFHNKIISYHRDTLLEPARTRGFDIYHGRKISDLQLLAKLQHFGAATGLLDFTWKPLVALWFASQDSRYDGCLFIVNTNNPVHVERVSSTEENQDMDCLLMRGNNSSPELSYWEPVWDGEAMSRILLQRSVFIIGHPLIPDNENIVRKIRIARDDKPLLLKDLELLDITQSSLFQDVYGFSQAQSLERVRMPTMQLEDSTEYIRQGNQFYQRGNYAKAIEAYNHCIISKPNVSVTYFLRGNAQAASGDHKKAIKDYDEAISHKDQPFPTCDSRTTKSSDFLALFVNPALFMVYFNRGNSKSVLTDYEGALKDYTEAIRCVKKDRDHSHLHFNRANTYMRLCDAKKAIDEYDKIKLISAHALFNGGNALMVLGRFDEALKRYEESAMKGMRSDHVGNNRSNVKKLIEMIGGREFDISFEQGGNIKSISMNVLVRIAGGCVAPYSLVFSGNAGNVGNFGGTPGLLGGEGLQGDMGICVRVEVRNGVG